MTTAKNNLRVYDDILEMINNPAEPTPMVKVNQRFSPNQDFNLYLKLERYNPFGSAKDRVAKAMLADVRIEPHQALAESSAGNTDIALAALANALGIPIEVSVPEKASNEKKNMLRLLGVKALWEAADDLCPTFPNEGFRGIVNGIMTSRGNENYVNLNQFENEKNIEAHYTGTGPEIWQQTGGKITHFFSPVGTCGTISGVGRFLKEQNPEIQIIGIEPTQAIHNLPGMKRISDLEKTHIPKIFDASVVDKIEEIQDDQAYETAVELAQKTGLMVSPTTGAALAIARRYSHTVKKGLSVIISPDDAFKYASLFHPYVKQYGEPSF